jgi:hypothetical protein
LFEFFSIEEWPEYRPLGDFRSLPQFLTKTGPFPFFFTASGKRVYTQVDIQWVSVAISNKKITLEKDPCKEMQISKLYKLLEAMSPSLNNSGL